MASDDPYERLRRVARRRGQRGSFTNRQATDAGLTASQLYRLVRRGIVERLAPRVYRFTVGRAPDWKDRLAAELLSTGGVACGLSAAALYGLSDPPARPQVLVVHGARRKAAGRHSTRELARFERVVVDGLPALAPVRMVLDAVHRLPPRQATALVEGAIIRGLVKLEALERRARELAHPKRPGCAVTLRILGELHPELARSRNQWEALVVRRAREYGLPAPRLEHEIVVAGRRYFADAAWPAEKVMLEFDGRDPHMRRRVHDHDSVRRNDLESAGWARFGLTAAALQRGDERAFRHVATALADRDAASGRRKSRIRD
jgi:very-short-patch-repair endonuclease